MPYERLPEELWNMVGDFIFSDIVPMPCGGVEIILKPARAFYITFADGLVFLHPLHSMFFRPA